MPATCRTMPGLRARSTLVGVALALSFALAACGDATTDDPTDTESGAGASTAEGATTEPGSDPAVEESETTPTEAQESTDDGGDGSGGDEGEAQDGQDDGAETTDDGQPAQPWNELELALEPVGAMSEPIDLVARPGSDHLWIAERVGRVRLIERTVNEAAGTEQLVQTTTPVLDIAEQVGLEGEGGLLGMAFSPDGSLLYLHYTDRSSFSVISEFPMGETTADAADERVLLRVEQPFANHNGGDLEFGPDGMLYASLGDGGSANDPLDSGQNADTLLGAIIRIDPAATASSPYGIPADNPFADGVDGAPEIWSWGLRNPWRFSFDPANGDLWIADVGQGDLEEINHLPAADGESGRGANLGWNLMEGDREFAGSAPPGHVPPLHVYDHGDRRCSVTGGFTYRGSFAPALDGVYLFADYCNSVVTGIEPTGGGEARVAALALSRTPENVISFGQGPDGELYVLEQSGRISRIQPADLPLETTLGSS